jgi:eukaryotic-like serine/threonine-protein kinase
MPSSPLDLLRTALGHRYAIERELGRGGMGAVYLGRDRQLDRPVALKVLPPEFAADPALRERFLRETRTAASFSHPNIVPVFAVEEAEDVLAFAMGFVEGESLSARVARAGPLSAREAVRLLQDIGYALAYAHGRSVVHRDLKPDNIMLERATGRALLMDFGISRTITAATPNAAAGLTRVGEVVGTPEFMSPEQACGDAVDGRSDLYSLGLVAYFALTGELAISGDSTQRILVQQLTQAVPSVGAVRTDLPAALITAVDTCTRKEPDERFASAEALIEVLDASQLAAPEIPYALRRFAREVGTVHIPVLACLGICAGIWYYVTQMLRWSVLDAMFLQSLFVAVAVARLWHARSEYWRLRSDGYDPAAIRRGFRAIVDEQEESRVKLRAQPAVLARRKRVLLTAIGVFVLAYVVEAIARASRTQIGPTQWHIPTISVAAFFLAGIMKGGSLVAIARTPLRMPIGERLFRWFWLGAPGAWMLGSNAAAGRIGRTVPPTGADTGPVRVPDSPPSVPRIVSQHRDVQQREIVDITPRDSLPALTLEDRVAELERWRATEELRKRPTG